MSNVPATAPAPFIAARYGGFWRRLIALVVDNFIVAILVGLALEAFGRSLLAPGLSLDDPAKRAETLAYLGRNTPIALLTVWLYEALMLSFGPQATVGKWLVGLKVVGVDGARLSFGRATLRLLVKAVGHALLGIGSAISALMLLFSYRKRAIHDRIAGTLVVRR
ncbi:MAG: RDD family protein [Rhodospirillales bacterium]|nr:RDD family protein [Rhodospirillales bacterium]QQS14538.1 MAG: RDD family protein [Rhodospirillales bacterium]